VGAFLFDFGWKVFNTFITRIIINYSGDGYKLQAIIIKLRWGSKPMTWEKAPWLGFSIEKRDWVRYDKNKEDLGEDQ
jgi:hypothetical protein